MPTLLVIQKQCLPSHFDVVENYLIMLDFFRIFPLELVLLTLIFVILPTIIAGILRHSLYIYLMGSANKVSRLLSSEKSRGKQPKIVNNLETRFRQASENLEQVNTIALIDGLYSQERLNFLGISLRCEQWDYFCQALPNLLLSFGLLGTFIGISSNLYNLSQTINQGSGDVSNLVAQLQTPLQNMGIAFFTSLTAIACSSILIGINLRCNTNFAKSLLISSLEDYLDNIYKVDINGYSRLDLAVDRMVKQQEEFLERFHVKVGEVLEITLGKAANQMVVANQDFQNNVDSLVSRFNDVSSSFVTSTNSFQDSVATLQSQVNTVTKIIPKFQSSSDTLERSSNIYLEGATKIENSKFSENLEITTLNLANITTDLATTQKSFSQSTTFLGNQVEEISKSHQQSTNLAEQVYSQLQQASSQLQDSADGFIKASETIAQTDFADKLATATKELTTIPQKFNQSTAILHKSTDSIEKAIDSINNSGTEITNLVQKVNNLNKYSSKLLESNNSKVEQEIMGLNQIKSELNTIANKLHKHQEKVNIGLEKFGSKLLNSFEQQTNKNTQEVNSLTNEAKKLVEQINKNKTELTKLISRLESCFNDFNSISDRLVGNFEQQSDNNVQEMQDLTKQLEKFLNNLGTTRNRSITIFGR